MTAFARLGLVSASNASNGLRSYGGQNISHHLRYSHMMRSPLRLSMYVNVMDINNASEMLCRWYGIQIGPLAVRTRNFMSLVRIPLKQRQDLQLPLDNPLELFPVNAGRSCQPEQTLDIGTDMLLDSQLSLAVVCRLTLESLNRSR